MYLKKIEIQGFKSFAEKIALEFNSGITAIVGPNGSGKSNVADAVRWVLGEQSIKALRGTKMEDIIFAGTEHRRPLGFAEVSLTFENSDSALPIGYSEVTIGRRIFRSGESEYFINKTPCRLKDINELFLDTGIGREGYSIIGQGRIEEILSTKSEDRRHIFEEASGIMKYKVRKTEAEKKLELTKQNMLRVNDIIIELENQLEPLRIQAETARKYLNLRESLKELEVNVYIDSITRFKEKTKDFEIQYQTIRDNMELENNKLEEITLRNKEKSELMRTLEQRLDLSRHEYRILEANIESCNSEIKINEEKISNLNKNLLRIDSEISEINNKLNTLSREEDNKQNRIIYLNQRCEEYSEKLAACEKQMDLIMAALDEAERNIEHLKAGIMDKLDLLSDKKTQVNNSKVFIESINKRKQGINNELQDLLLDQDKENMTAEDLAESIRKAKEAALKSAGNLAALFEEKKGNDHLLDEYRKKQNVTKSALQFKTSRQKMLKDMESNLEGYNRSVREILHTFRQTHPGGAESGAGIHGALAQLIKVEQRYEAAIEMTLGSVLQNIVTGTEDDARRAISFLKANKYGRATFLPLTSVKGKYIDNETLNELAKQNGFCGIASDLVGYDPRYTGIVLNYLGRVAVVESLEAGIDIARKFSYAFRIATLDGDIISGSGSITGGSMENRNSGILGRNREIAELMNDVEKLGIEAASIEKEIGMTISRLDIIIKSISEEELTVRNQELIKIRDENHLAHVKENLLKIASKAEILKQEKNQLIRQETDVLLEVEKHGKELEAIEADITETKKIIAEHQEKHREEQSVRDSLSSDITDLKISVNSVLESLDNVKETISRIESEKDVSVKGLNRRKHEKEKNFEEIRSLEEKNEGILRKIKSHEEERTGRTFEMDRIAEERRVMEEELIDTVNLIQDINRNILLLQEDLGRIEIRKSKVESDVEVIQNRLWDEYELTYTNALQVRKDIGSIIQAQKKIQEYRNEIRELGTVNVSSIDDYVRTRERYELMTAQKDDMEKAEEKLRKIINEMTHLMKQQFMEQFRLINDNFSVVFRELFDGGHARLALTDADNVLESGIEIEVQPPGKKLQNMMLLSGGERAFTATALLFAILRLKPVPFCFLDEVEATLDDANVYRFAEYLRNFIKQTQFVIITHRKGTMEISDTLYGVTMQEHGVSKIVSMKMA